MLFRCCPVARQRACLAKNSRKTSPRKRPPTRLKARSLPSEELRNDSRAVVALFPSRRVGEVEGGGTGLIGRHRNPVHQVGGGFDRLFLAGHAEEAAVELSAREPCCRQARRGKKIQS